MTPIELQAKAQLARDRADRIRAMRDRAMREALTLAGIGAWSGLNVLHNALISADQGKPWAEVNYHHARRAAWLESRLFDGHAIANTYICRLLREVTR